ncbi:MAG: Hpt domain-containing protein [Lachnospiraceae bacterium]|nr:Hpt domain-containing protein [Lachnospiraceae bacterium]
MLTIETLKAYGANTGEGVARCLNNEGFYLNLVKTVPNDTSIASMRDAIAANDLDTAFESAHALKGVLGNLSLTPLLQPVSEITEFLRARKEMDYTPLLEELQQQFDALVELCKE